MGPSLRSPQAQPGDLVLPTFCVTLGLSLALPEPQFPHLHSELWSQSCGFKLCPRAAHGSVVGLSRGRDAGPPSLQEQPGAHLALDLGL